jgi:hypothetical protein
LKIAERTSWEHVLPDLKNFKNKYKLNPVATTTLGCRIIFLLEFLKRNKSIFDYLVAFNPPNHIYQEDFKRMNQPCSWGKILKIRYLAIREPCLLIHGVNRRSEATEESRNAD